MAVHINEAGDHGGTLEVNGIFRHHIRQDLAEPAVGYLKGTLTEGEITAKNSGMCIKHRR